jgi:hypothetical protein
LLKPFFPPIPEPNRPQVFVKTTNGTMGGKYLKAVFRPYTDETFSTRAPHDEALGILGPTIRAESGDKVVVHFLNKLPFNASVQVGCGCKLLDGWGGLFNQSAAGLAQAARPFTNNAHPSHLPTPTPLQPANRPLGGSSPSATPRPTRSTSRRPRPPPPPAAACCGPPRAASPRSRPRRPRPRR